MAVPMLDGQPIVRDFAYQDGDSTTNINDAQVPVTPDVALARKDSIHELSASAESTDAADVASTEVAVLSDITNGQTPSPPEAHPQATEILRQVEYYFSDTNLVWDAHLLGLMKEGNGSVSLNAIMGFRKMKAFKPKAAVREVLKQSRLIELTADGKRIRRRERPKVPLMVTPRVDEQRAKLIVPDEKPWLTKGMMKPTGFEEGITEGPIKPEEYTQDLEDYGADVSFIQRIETAVARFTAKRKMHQQTRLIFTKFMLYGGMQDGPNMFTGGISEDERKSLTAKELAERTCTYGVSERVVDAFDLDNPNGNLWVVDFEATAKGFLSSQLPSLINWHDTKQIVTATNVLRNFYNYLLLHDVCKEYREQLIVARKICDLAEEELPKLAFVDKNLPGDFNKACSIIFMGQYSGMQAGEDKWDDGGDEDLYWSCNNAKKIFCAGIAAYASDEILSEVEEYMRCGKRIGVVSVENVGLEVVAVDYMSERAKEVYNSPQLSNTFIRPIGTLRCKRWKVPHLPTMDLPASVNVVHDEEEVGFLINEDILRACHPGMKMEACVKKLDNGIEWIDVVTTTYASFFMWLENENIREWKEPGPPRGWMGRQIGGAVEQIEGEEQDERDMDSDEDEPA